jgi:DNA-directed RNA polymerase specialized sigma24 family protein
MPAGPSDTTLLSLLKSANTPAVAQEIWTRYFHRLAALARGKVRERTRRVTDEEDVALSAFDSFFRGVEQGRFPQLNDHDDLWQVLMVLTERKAIDAIRRQTAEKRGGGEVRGESVFLKPDGTADHQGLEKAADSEPSPELVVQFAEECLAMLSRLQDAELQEVALLKMEGYTNDEIAQKLGRVTRSIERKLQTIRKIWEREIET